MWNLFKSKILVTMALRDLSCQIEFFYNPSRQSEVKISSFQCDDMAYGSNTNGKSRFFKLYRAYVPISSNTAFCSKCGKH